MAAAAEADDPELDIAVQLARGRAHYILSLDEPAHAHASRDAYEAAYVAAERQGDKTSMARALLPTTWFTDYWADYGPTASANSDEALRLAEEIGDEDLVLDAQAAAMHRGGVTFNAETSEELLARLEERRDPVKLNAHCFWMMWQYQALGRFADSVATCDRGIELSDLIGSSPVQGAGPSPRRDGPGPTRTRRARIGGDHRRSGSDHRRVDGLRSGHLAAEDGSGPRRRRFRRRRR